MASKKGGRSSKTEHVLNLLAGSGPAPAAPPQSAAEGGDAVPPESREIPSSRHLAPPVLEVARVNQQALSETIHHALEDALQAELEAARPQPPHGPETTAGDLPPQAETAQPPQLCPAAPSDEEVPVVPPGPPEEEPATVPPVPNFGRAPVPLPDGSWFVNVMALLAAEKLERYVKLFGLCRCPRCLADAQALALSQLRAKYVVLSQAALSPMLELYRSKYDVEITAQVIFACKTVMEHPRHSQTGPTP